MQTKLFYEDEDESLQWMVSGSGKSIKDIAQFLWPEMKPESAYAKLKACLNPKGDEHLRFGQVIALMKFCNLFDPLYYACDDTLHARPDRKLPEDESVKLVETIERSTDTLHKAIMALERLRTHPITLRTASGSA
jgi:hypothetical protein